jgi:hypothetical protein
MAMLEGSNRRGEQSAQTEAQPGLTQADRAVIYMDSPRVAIT